MAFPTEENVEQTALANWEIDKTLRMHQKAWGADHAKLIQRDNIVQAVMNNPDLQMGAFLVKNEPNKRGGKVERLLGCVTVARFNTRKISINSDYDTIRRKHDPNGDAASCFIVSVKPRLPKGLGREELERLIQAAGGKKLVDLILNGVHAKANGLFRQGRLKYMFAWSTPADIHRNTGNPKGQRASDEQIRAHLEKGNDRVIHGTHIRLGAQVDGVIPDGRPNTQNLTGAGALVRMRYPLG